MNQDKYNTVKRNAARDDWSLCVTGFCLIHLMIVHGELVIEHKTGSIENF